MAKILTDLHHHDLYRSLQYLFEDRLGYKLYRPIGLEWFAQGYWKIAEVYNNDWQTINQYLSTEQANIPAIHRQNDELIQEGEFYRLGKERAVTFQGFLENDWDYIIASVPAHFETYRIMRDRHKPEAKVICQMGNRFDFPWDNVQNLMASTKKVEVPKDVNAVFYHQEFDLNVFAPEPEPNHQNGYITSFLNLFNRHPDYGIWQELPNHLPGWTFGEFGWEGKDGFLETPELVAGEMNKSCYIFQFKSNGDGFGHVIHNIFACGKVAVVKKQHYMDELAGELMTNNETCLFWDESKPVEWNAKRLQNLTYNDRARIGAQALARFNQVVNYEEETNAVRRFIERCK